MKKIVERVSNTIILGASSCDGIAFTVVYEIFLGKYVYAPTVRTTICEGIPASGVTKEKYTRSFLKKKETVEHIMREIFGKIIFICLLFIMLFWRTDVRKNFLSLLFILISIFRYSWIFVTFVKGKIFRKKEYLNLARYHAAEHAAINAFYDLNSVPTIEQIKKYSNFSPRCLTLRALCRIVVWWILAIVVLLPKYRLLVGVILYILLVIIYYNKKLYFMEFLVTSNPTDSEYEVAISGLTEALKEYYNSEFYSVIHDEER